MPLPSTRHRIFVYGTLMPGGRYYRMLCEGKIDSEIPAWTRGELWHLPYPCNYPGMTLGERRVEGWLLSFDDDNLRAQLDELEGYDPSRPTDENEYNAIEQEVFAPDGQSLGMATVYVMAPNIVAKSNGMRVPEGRWQEE